MGERSITLDAILTLIDCRPTELLFRSKVTGPGADLQGLFEGNDLDGAKTSVGVKICRVVGDHILAAQLVFDGGKRILDVLHLVREEGAATGRIRQLL